MTDDLVQSESPGARLPVDETYAGHLVLEVDASVSVPRDTLVGAVVGAMVETNDPPRTFVRGGALARFILDESDRPRLQTIADDATMRTVLLTHVRFVKFVRRRGEWERERLWPPRELVQTVRTLGRWGRLPAVEAIVEAPTMRADGTILDTPGYDAASRLIYQPATGLTVPAVAPEPTGEDVEAAVTLLRRELLADFPFTTPADEANALALLLTPIVRPSLRCVPLALITAPRAGTGKGLLASCAARIATGRPARVFPAPDEDREWGKALGAVLDAGATFIFIDEARRLDSPRLAAALTADSYTDRRLGQSEMIEVPQRATWVAAGNNVELGGDLPRRVYSIRLDPKVARPWTRNGWRHADLEGWAAAHRGELLGALLTIARAWHAAGRPTASVPVLGGFSEWAQTVGGMLSHAGVRGFLGNLAELYDRADDDANAWEAFLEGLAAITSGAPFITGRVANLVTSGPLSDVLPDELAAKLGTPGFKVALGRALRRKVDTRHGDRGLHLAHAGRDGHSKAPMWVVATDRLQADAGGAGVCGGSVPTHMRAPAHTRAVPSTPRNSPHPPQLEGTTSRG